MISSAASLLLVALLLAVAFQGRHPNNIASATSPAILDGHGNLYPASTVGSDGSGSASRAAAELEIGMQELAKEEEAIAEALRNFVKKNDLLHKRKAKLVEDAVSALSSRNDAAAVGAVGKDEL